MTKVVKVGMVMHQLRRMGRAVIAVVSTIKFDGVAASDVLVTHRLPANLAGEAVLAAVASCASAGYGVTALVMDMDGVVQASLRGDSASIMTVDAVGLKAYTSVSTKVDTGILVERYKNNPPPAVFEKVPRFVIAQGGVIIKLGDEAIAALAVAGAPTGDKDEACARAGLGKIADRLKKD
jgi:uncharacterized protein GlcG (DUF336 family)